MHVVILWASLGKVWPLGVHLCIMCNVRYKYIHSTFTFLYIVTSTLTRHVQNGVMHNIDSAVRYVTPLYNSYVCITIEIHIHKNV